MHSGTVDWQAVLSLPMSGPTASLRAHETYDPAMLAANDVMSCCREMASQLLSTALLVGCASGVSISTLVSTSSGTTKHALPSSSSVCLLPTAAPTFDALLANYVM